MSILGKLFTALKGGATEIGEAIVDNQAIRILEQEIRDAKDELAKSDQALINIIAKRKTSEQKIRSFNENIEQYENYAKSAVEKNEQGLALECAQKICQIKNEKETEQNYMNQYVQSEQLMQNNIAQAKAKLKQLEQQIDIVKATDAVQKAQISISETSIGANKKMHTAVESLDRIKKKQQETAARIEAAHELAAANSDQLLEEKLKSAGIGSVHQSAEEELARILSK